MSRQTPTAGLLRTALVLSLSVLFINAASAADTSRPSPESDAARQILDTSGFTGGLIVEVGCAGGKLTAALHAAGGQVVQGLDTDPDRVRQARRHLRERGTYGPVSVDRFDGTRLPYVDNMVNLLVVHEPGGISTAEALRVLAPGGTLCTEQEGRWTRTVKPRPENIDEWTHYLHDAGGNPVAHDELVGPPGHVQWIADPPYTRSHEHIPSIYALVSSGGRIFYLIDEAPISSIRRIADWHLAARDAFNGTLLWKQPIAAWFPHVVGWGKTPPQLQRKLVAAGDRVYVTLGIHSPLCAVEAATGRVVKVYENTLGAEEIVLHRGILLVVLREVTAERTAEMDKFKELIAKAKPVLDDRDTAEPLVQRLRDVESSGDKAILAINASTGELLWRKSESEVAGLKVNSLSACGPRVFYQGGRGVTCVDLESGRQEWTEHDAADLRLVSGDRVFCADGDRVQALSADTGRLLWSEKPLLCEVRDLFVAGGSLWAGGHKPWQGRTSGKRGPAWGPYFVTQRDLDTGEVLMHIEPDNPGHHHRCYQNKATDRYILGGRRGTEFIDLGTGDVLWNSWARGVCKYGVMPANGLLYVPPHACACYVSAKLIGFNALAARRDEPSVSSDEARVTRLQRGPAYAISTPNPSALQPTAYGLQPSSFWSTYRGNPGRTGSTSAVVPTNLQRRWQTSVADRITSPTVADGKVFVAAIDRHTVFALDADTGRPAWDFTAGARVDSPPTIHQGRAIFGCRDGCVYSLRTSDGEPAWRFLAARQDRRIAARGQIESVSPVKGSVLINDGTVYLTAGRSSYTDGGIDLYRLEPASGKVLSRSPIYSPDPDTGRQPEQSAMPGAREDILTAADGRIYLRDMSFDTTGTVLSDAVGHLFSLTGFLDDSWTHRSFWVFGTECSISTGCSGRNKEQIYGRLMVHDDDTIYGFGRLQVHWSNQLLDGPYRLFAVGRGGGDELWQESLPVEARAMLLAGDVLFVAGPRTAAVDRLRGADESREALLLAVSASDGAELARHSLDASPLLNGIAAAGGRLYISLENGEVLCMEKEGR